MRREPIWPSRIDNAAMTPVVKPLNDGGMSCPYRASTVIAIVPRTPITTMPVTPANMRTTLALSLSGMDHLNAATMRPRRSP